MIVHGELSQGDHVDYFNNMATEQFRTEFLS